MDNYLLDSEFLKKLDYQKNKEIYIRITSLSNDEYPRETIEGKATGGSINIDGASAIRRSCSLSLVTVEEILTDEFWCYNNKFKLEIGLNNNIDAKYANIIWFNMGIYIITGFNKNKSLTGYSISISGKDKMCRLNGEVSGNITETVNFGIIEQINEVEEVDENGEITKTWETRIDKLPIYNIIQNAIQVYGQERIENIIIKDLDQFAYELWEYRGDNPMYIFIEIANNSVINMTLNGDTKVNTQDSEVTLNKYEEEGYKFYSMNTLDLNYNNTATIIKYNTLDCYIAKIEYGETAGYHQIPLVYNGDLIIKAGETITSMLDKLKTLLGDFEYFYDLEGRFVFQKQDTYVKELFSQKDGELLTPSLYTTQYSYQFTDEELFTSISTQPNINTLKNDFSIWGTKQSTSGMGLPIHARYAIDVKPKQYRSLPWYDENGNLKERSYTYTTQYYDWREIIYRMAVDFYRHNQESDFLIRLEKYNPEYIGGKTGYEQYYTDIQGFWRQLYNPYPNDWDEEQYGKFYNSLGSDGKGNAAYWNQSIHLNPGNLLFWFDFLEPKGEMRNYSVKQIGARSKVVNESTINSIYLKETPEILFVVAPGETIASKGEMAYMPIWIQDNMETLFYKTSQGKSAISQVNEALYNNTAQTEGISITSMPIYYLQPNTRIYIEGYGDYVLSKISYSLNYNGTMSLSGNKIIRQFY